MASTQPTTPTLVMGAGGSIGRHVLDSLIARGLPVLASTRRRPGRGQFPDGIDVRSADLTQSATLTEAFEGVGQVFLYAHREGVQGVIDSARAAGVTRIVLMSSGSVIHPSSRGNAIAEEHREVEAAFRAASDLTVLPIRPLVLATNALAWAASINARGALSLYQPDALTAPIHERDIAAVAVAALIGPGDTSGLLTGPARITQREQVAVIAEAVSRPIEVRDLPRRDALAGLSRFMSAVEAEAVVQFLDDAAQGNSPATDTVERVLGRPATSFTCWAADHVSDFLPRKP